MRSPNTAMMQRKTSALLIVFLFLIMFAQASVAGQQETVISGRVLEDQTGSPIQDARVLLLGPRRRDPVTGRYVQSTKNTLTDSSGFFSLKVEEEGLYTVYAFCDRGETPGVDYVPARWKPNVEIGSQAFFVFSLQPGASIFLEGDIRFVESQNTAHWWSFTVLDPSGDLTGDSQVVSSYGMVEDAENLGLDPSLVIVPAEKEVAVNVEARVADTTTRTQWDHIFTVDSKDGFFKLAEGSVLNIDVSECMLEYNTILVKSEIHSALSMLLEAEDSGFFVTTERQELLRAQGLLNESMNLNEAYYVSFAILRNAYILSRQTRNQLGELFEVGSLSAYAFPFFFVIVALAISSLVPESRGALGIKVAEGPLLRIPVAAVTCSAICVMLSSFFYFLYPGYRLIPLANLVATSVVALFLGLIFIMAMPRLEEKKSIDRHIAFRSAVAKGFSIASRNLQRKKLRTILNVSTIMTLVFGFITLTSIAPNYGFVTRFLGKSWVSTDALFVRVPLPTGSFAPLPTSFIAWLGKQPNVTILAPRAENSPSLSPLGTLYTSSGNSAVITGVVGIVPSMEKKISTLLDTTVVKGDLPQDDDIDGVMISLSLATRIGVDLGDILNIFEQRLIVRGLFDDQAMEELRDIRGSHFLPWKLTPMGGCEPCRADQIILTSLERALTLPTVAISAASVKLKDPQDLSGLAQIITLVYEFPTWFSFEGHLYAQKVGAYIEMEGLQMTPILMVLVMLNIGSTAFGSIMERKKEVASMSSIGLNPTHIAALFFAEALIVGLVGSGLGYISGISGYRAAALLFPDVLQVREKVSAGWGALTILLSVAVSILGTAIPAMKASTIVTPSSLLKWRLNEKPKESDQPWIEDIPVRLRSTEREAFLRFLEDRMREYRHQYVSVDEIRLERSVTQGAAKRLHFRFYISEKRVDTKNEIAIVRSTEKRCFDLKLISYPIHNDSREVQEVVSFVRELTLEWKAATFKVVTPFDTSSSQAYTLVRTYSPTTLIVVSQEVDIAHVKQRLRLLEERLDLEGIRVPKITISPMNPFDIEDCRKKATDIVLNADVVCISDGPSSICVALALASASRDRKMCCVADRHPLEEGTVHPYQVLKVVELT